MSKRKFVEKVLARAISRPQSIGPAGCGATSRRIEPDDDETAQADIDEGLADGGCLGPEEVRQSPTIDGTRPHRQVTFNQDVDRVLPPLYAKLTRALDA